MAAGETDGAVAAEGAEPQTAYEDEDMSERCAEESSAVLDEVPPQEPEADMKLAQPLLPCDKHPAAREEAVAEAKLTPLPSVEAQPAMTAAGSEEGAAPAEGPKETAGEPEEAEAAPAQQESNLEEDIEVDIEAEAAEEEDFLEAEDVFETPSQQPCFMTPGTSFGTGRQQFTAYKTGQEHLTGSVLHTGRFRCACQCCMDCHLCTHTGGAHVALRVRCGWLTCTRCGSCYHTLPNAGRVN